MKLSRSVRCSWHLLAALIATISLMACSDGPQYSSFQRLPGKGWAYGDTLAVRFASADSVAAGTLCVALKHTNDYRFANLWLEVTVPQADGSVRRDTVNVPMADPYGRWYGGGIGTSFQLSDTVAQHVSVDMTRPLLLRHIMRLDTLTDIELIGLTLTIPQK